MASYLLLGLMACFWESRVAAMSLLFRIAVECYKARTIQRRSIGDRWDIASSDQVRYVPWKVSEDDEKADGEGLVAIKLTDEEMRAGQRERVRSE